jgi:hypothetical protein
MSQESSSTESAGESMGDWLRAVQAARKQRTMAEQQATPDVFAQANAETLIAQLKRSVDEDIHVRATKAVGRVYWSADFSVEQGQYVLDETLRLLLAKCDGMTVVFAQPDNTYPFGGYHTFTPLEPGGKLQVCKSSSDDLEDFAEGLRHLEDGHRFREGHATRLETRDILMWHVAELLASRALGPQPMPGQHKRFVHLFRSKSPGLVFDKARVVGFDWGP